MPPRAAINNGIITVVIVFFMFILGMLLKARYRLGSEGKAQTTAAVTVPKAIPVAIPVEVKVNEARAYKQGDWWILPKPEFVVNRGNEADTLRIRTGTKEDVFVLYFVDAPESTATRLQRLKEQSDFFHASSSSELVRTGESALTWVNETLTEHNFTVYTKWGRVPNTERYYAMILVETAPGKQEDLGEMLVRRGFAALSGQQTKPLPEGMPELKTYRAKLVKAAQQAQGERAGAWALAPAPAAAPVAPEGG